jgi:hypothetical protein
VSRDLHPTAGARYLLELAAATDAGATYRCAIYTRDAEFACEAQLGAEAIVSPSGAPPELHARLETIAKLVARDAPPWPNRILRWRK